MYFKCISHLIISYFLSLPPPNGQNTMCCFHRCSIGSFETGLTSASNQVVMILIMLIMEIEMIMTMMMMTVMRNTSGNDCSHYQNSICCVGSRWSIFHRILLPLPCSAWPGYDDYEMMSVLCVFVWECICVWECVFVSFSLQTLDKSLVSHWGNVKFTCHKIFWSGSCIVVQGISKGQLQFRKALRKSGRSPVDLPGFLMAFLFIWRKKKKVVDIVGFQKEHHVIFC